MGERTESLARRFEQQHEEIVRAVEGFSDEEWRRMCADEARPVNVLCHHIGEGYEFSAGLVQAVATGQPTPPVSMADVDAFNAQHAEQRAACSKQEALEHLRQTAAAALATVRGLDDAQLDRTGTVFGQTMTAEQVAEMLFLGHAQGHWQSIRQAVPA